MGEGETGARRRKEEAKSQESGVRSRESRESRDERRAGDVLGVMCYVSGCRKGYLAIQLSGYLAVKLSSPFAFT